MRRKDSKTIIELCKMTVNRTYNMCTVKYDTVLFFIKTVYCRGSGLKLLSTILSLAVCHVSSAKRPRKFSLSVTFGLSESIA